MKDAEGYETTVDIEVSGEQVGYTHGCVLHEYMCAVQLHDACAYSTLCFLLHICFSSTLKG